MKNVALPAAVCRVALLAFFSLTIGVSILHSQSAAIKLYTRWAHDPDNITPQRFERGEAGWNHYNMLLFFFTNWQVGIGYTFGN